ncbi:MAG: endonuclease domain-containing protein [Firmicutes bacterium]|nr:endonuclease domain-containing protein [Bacillota bacterium]
MFHYKRKSITEKAKVLRKEPTAAEAVLWEQLRKGKLKGFKIRRQHPIGCYIADFYCANGKLAIEIDGGVHDNKDVKEYDEVRQQAIEYYGIRVIRFKNEDVFNRIEFVLKEIENNLIDLSS